MLRRAMPRAQIFRRNLPFSLLLWVLFSWVNLPAQAAAPRYVYLTWQGDTSTTLTVNYQTMDEAQSSTVYYDTEPRGTTTNGYRFQATGTRHKHPDLPDNRTIHWVELTGLKPG